VVNLRQAFRGTPAVNDVVPKRWVVYLTGGPEDDRLLQIVEQVAENPQSHITLAYVVEVQQSMPLDAELPNEVVRGEDVLVDAERFATRCVGGRRQNVSSELLQARSAGPAVVDQAIDDNADAILIACSMRKKHGRATVGDAVDYILRNAPCEVIVVRTAVNETANVGDPKA
jgi:nucleotide-binding universal stress UspA family protein